MNTKPKIDPYLSLMEIPPGYLNIMGYVDRSQVNGPGSRAVVWLQGCIRECPGCFNSSSWSFEINQLISVEQLTQKLSVILRTRELLFLVENPFGKLPHLQS